MRNDYDTQLDVLLSSQYGCFSRAQANTIGFTDSMAKTRVRSGPWIRVDHGVYRHAAHRVTWEQRCMCALLSRPGSLLAARTASALHQVTGFNKGRLELDVTHGSGRSNLATIHRSPHRQPRRVRGLAVQSVSVALLEVAGVVSDAKLKQAVQDAIILGTCTAETLVDWYVRMATSRRPGIGKMRNVLDRLVIGELEAESVLEGLLHDALTDGRIAPFNAQAPFPWSPDEPYRIDVYIEAWGMLVEADGRRWHARLETMEDDRARDREATRRGLLPVRFGWGDLQNVEDVRTTLLDIATAHGRLCLPGAA